MKKSTRRLRLLSKEILDCQTVRTLSTTIESSTRAEDRENVKSLLKWFEQFESCIVAFSAGVDSSLVAWAAKSRLGDRAIAVTSISPAFALSERIETSRIAKEIGVKLIEVRQDDMSDENYVRNDVRRCYFCRSNLVDAIKPIAEKYSIAVCVDGTHVDDVKSPRPGVKALREAGFRAPLTELGFGKAEIREMAKRVGLSNWDRPSEACLSSRIAFGERIDADRLRKVELAEQIVASLTGARIVRVRAIGTRASIEVDRDSVNTAKNVENALGDSLKKLGFEVVAIDPEGYVSGKMLELYVQNERS